MGWWMVDPLAVVVAVCAGMCLAATLLARHYSRRAEAACAEVKAAVRAEAPDPTEQ